jgi:hypothetical protein
MDTSQVCFLLNVQAVAPRLVWDPAYGLRTSMASTISQVCFPLNNQAWELRIMTTTLDANYLGQDPPRAYWTWTCGWCLT